MKKLLITFMVLFILPLVNATTFLDDFNRADNITIGNNWTESLTPSGFAISGNRLNLTRDGSDTYIHRNVSGDWINVTFTYFAEVQNTNMVFNFQTGIYNQASRGCGIWFPNGYGNDQMWYHTDNFADVGALCDDCIFANNSYVISLIYNMSSLTVGTYIDGVYQGNFEISGTCENADIIGFGTEDFNGQWFIDNIIVQTPTVSPPLPLELTDGLVHYYHVNETDMVSSLDGVICSGQSPVLSSFAVSGQSLIFNGSSGYRFAGLDATVNSASNFSISMWIYWNGSSTFDNVLAGFMSSSLQDIQWQNGGDYGNGLWNHYTSSWQGDGVVDLTPNTWYNILFTWQESNKERTYINGVNLGNITASAWLYESGVDTFAWGNSYDICGSGSNGFIGFMSDFGVWNRALTTTEVTELYNSGSGLFYNGSEFAEYFAPCVEDWSETHVNLTGCINDTQQVMEIYIDLNGCNTTINLPAENGTIENISCTNCTEDWDAYFVNNSCNISDQITEIKLYEDESSCNTTNDLPIDNGTISNTFPCNYCTENIQQYSLNFACISQLQNTTTYYIDLNYASCCFVTSIVTDCHVTNGSYNNITVSSSCTNQYTAGDLSGITADVIGSFLVNFKYWVPLIILMLVILVLAIAVGMFRRK